MIVGKMCMKTVSRQNPTGSIELRLSSDALTYDSI